MVNRAVISDFLNQTDVDSDYILSKVQGLLSHGGGAQLTFGGEDYNALLQYLQLIPKNENSIVSEIYTATKGKIVFEQPHENGNFYACMNCHSVTELNDLTSTSDARIRSGNPIFNAANRSSYKNGMLNNIMDAANSCLQDWMKVSSDNTWIESSEDWLNLNEYLIEQSNNENTSDVTYTIVDAPDDLSAGDATAGHVAFNKTCVECHGVDGKGALYSAEITGVGLAQSFVANKIRRSGPSGSNVYSGLGGVGAMPFYSQERMSDKMVKDISAYVAGITENDGDTPPQMEEDVVMSGDSTCSGTDHAKVGQTMIFSNLAHGISGSAKIVDNCTIEISGFDYDGQGPSVFFYGGLNNDYRGTGAGFSIGNQLNGRSYNNATITLSLSSTSILDNMDGLSVWCSDFDVSFGDGQFM
jgi:mono/diheme cytochrome c family protein